MSEGPFSAHPGFLGLTSRGVVALHANWPAYPAEHGGDVALGSLGRFPAESVFKPIDDIDRCVLFVLVPEPSNDPFDVKGFHVAIWHEDLLELHHQGFIIGVVPTTERGWEESRRQHLPDDLFIQLSSGEMRRVTLPNIDTHDDESADYVSFAHEAVRLTRTGWQHLDTILRDSLIVPPELSSRVGPLIEAGLFDSAIREVAIAMESRLRDATQSTDFGLRLVDQFITRMSDSAWIGAHVKLMRAELRTAFKFVRNEFAHNLVDLPRPRGLALLSQMCSLYEDVKTCSDV